MFNCPKCQIEYPADAVACPNCGLAVGQAAKKNKLPLIFFVIAFLFAIYILREIAGRLFLS